MTTYVYIIKSQKHLKIGISDNVEKRIKQIQNGNPYLLKLLAKIEMPSRKSALNFEKYLHARFDSKRKVGEWFKAKSLNLKSAIRDYEGGTGGVDYQATSLGSAQKEKVRDSYNRSSVLLMQRARLAKLLSANGIKFSSKLLCDEINISQMRKVK